MGLLDIQASEAEEERVALGRAGTVCFVLRTLQKHSEEHTCSDTCGLGSICPRLWAMREETALVNTWNVTVLSPGPA